MLCTWQEDFDRFLSRVDKLHGDHDDDGDDEDGSRAGSGSQQQKRPPTVLLFQLPFTFRLPEGKDARTDPRTFTAMCQARHGVPPGRSAQHVIRYPVRAPQGLVATDT